MLALTWGLALALALRLEAVEHSYVVECSYERSHVFDFTSGLLGAHEALMTALGGATSPCG